MGYEWDLLNFGAQIFCPITIEDTFVLSLPAKQAAVSENEPALICLSPGVGL